MARKKSGAKMNGPTIMTQTSDIVDKVVSVLMPLPSSLSGTSPGALTGARGGQGVGQGNEDDDDDDENGTPAGCSSCCPGGCRKAFASFSESCWLSFSCAASSSANDDNAEEAGAKFGVVAALGPTLNEDGGGAKLC